MDSNQWMTQEMHNGGLRGIPMGEIASSSAGSSGDRKLQLARPQKDKVVNCPRCNSTNTKFCYYNNYSLTQPRYFCKSCRRYWTEGGTLRNVPVGGGSRKHKRSTSLSAATALTTPPSSSASAVSASAVMSSSHKMNNIPDLNPPNMSFHHHGNPSMDHQGQDLNLGGYHFEQLMKSSSTTSSSALELLRTGALLGSNSSSNDFMNTSAIYANNNGSSSGFSFQELKPGLSFASSVHHANMGGIQENGGRMMFPFGGMMKNMAVPSSTTVITTTAADHNQVNGGDQNNQVSNANGFWNNGGSW